MAGVYTYDLDGHSWQGREQELDVGLAVTCLLRVAWCSRQPIQLRGVDEIRKAALERLLHFVSNLAHRGGRNVALRRAPRPD